MASGEKTTQDFERASGPRRLKDIPDYRTTDEEIRATLDAIIDSTGEMTEEKARTFGNEVLGQVQETSNQIVHAMQNEENGIFKEPLQNCLDDMQGLDLEKLQGTISSYVSKGSRAVSRNKGKAALTTVGALTMPFVTAAAFGAYYLGGKYLPSKYVPGKKDENSIEEVAERIKLGVVKSEEHVRNLQLAQKHVPVLLGRIDDLNVTNRDAFIATTYHIAAGREIALRLRENELATAEAEYEQSPSFEAEDDLNRVKDIVGSLEYQLTVLEMARNESVTSSLSLRDMKEAIVQNERSLRSLLTTEVPNWRRTLATAGMALDTFETTKVASQFRNHLEDTQDDTAKAATEALRASDAGRVDNPERLERAIQRTIEFRENLADRTKALTAMEETIAKRRQTLEKETTALLSAGNQNMIEQSAEDKPAMLEHQQTASAEDVADAVEEAIIVDQPAPSTPKP